MVHEAATLASSRETLNNPPVFHCNNPIGSFGKINIVGDNQQSLVVFLGQFFMKQERLLRKNIERNDTIVALIFDTFKNY